MDKQQKIIISIMSVILLAFIVTTAFILIDRRNETVMGEFEAPPFDENAVSGVPDVDAWLNYREINVAEGFAFSMCGNLTLSDSGCVVYFTSPSNNAVWLLMKLYDEEGNVLGQSQIVRPGEYVECIALSKRPKTSTAVKVKILSYEPETYYSQGSAEASFIINVRE